jgi:ubiquinone/menaquinone biosynthesis C-methylase UbiE
MRKKNEKMKKNREKIIFEMIPKDVNTILDIGGGNSMFKEKYKVITIDVVCDADIKQDLNKNQRLNLKSNNFDLIVMNQILEHLANVEEIVNESKRISKKYILIGLPNEITFTDRLYFLIGKPRWKGYNLYGHKHFFTIEEADKFVKKFFGNWKEKRYLGAFACAKLLPDKMRNSLAQNFPRLFAKNIFYLIKLK